MNQHLSMEEAAGLESLSYDAYRKRLQRRGVVLERDPTDRRKEIVPVRILSARAGEAWAREQALKGSTDKSLLSPLQPRLPFTPDAAEVSLLAPAGKHHDLVMRKISVVYRLIYERWKEDFSTEGDFIRTITSQEGKGFNETAIREWKTMAWTVFHDPAIPPEQRWVEIAHRLIPKPRPGRSNFSFFSGSNASNRKELVRVCRNGAGRSVTSAYEMFCASLPANAERPSLRQVRTALSHLPVTDTLRGREALRTAGGYIDRHYDDELAGDAWCIDEWELDGAFFDEDDHSRLINYGQHSPIAHILSLIDERTTRILGWILTWKVSLEEATLTLAERLLREFWLPKRLIADRAGRFRRLARGRVILGRDGELIELLAGPLGELGVRPRLTEESNPRGNRIERSAHREYARKAAKDFGISWRGANTRERAMTDIDERVSRHLREHCKYGTCGPQLLSIQRAEQIVAEWVNDLNFAKTRAKGCKGMTRLAAFNFFRPSEEEIARRKVSEALADLAFAERDARTIQTGGIVELPDHRRYSDVQLVSWTGDRVEVLRYRRDPSFLQVFPPGQEAPVIAHLRRAVGANDLRALSEEIERLNHDRKIIAREEESLLMDGRQDEAITSPPRFEKPARPEKPRFADDIARKALELERMA